MAEDFDPAKVVAELKERAERERASGGYPEDLSDVELEKPGSIVEGFDLQSGRPRVEFRPQLGFSSKPVVGPAITLVKRFYLRLLLYVFEDLARQTDTAIGRVEAALAVEVAARERLQREVRDLDRELRALRGARGNEPSATEGGDRGGDGRR
jgi:hypothetical protein